MPQKNVGQFASFHLIAALLVMALLAGCASGVSKSIKVSDDDLAKYQVMTAAEAVQSLASALEAARLGQLSVYTPRHYAEAEKRYQKVLKSLEAKKKKKDIIRDVAKADRLLAKAKIIKLEVVAELGDLLSVDKRLILLNAHQIYKKDYEGMKKKLIDLIGKVEEGKAEKIAKDKVTLLKAFKALEVKGIKYAALHEADQINQQAKAQKALKLTPKTYAASIRVYQQADAAISQSPYDKDNVTNAKQSALFAAKHVLNVTQQVVSLTKRFKKSPEQVVLDEENRILEISEALDQSDYRDRKIEDQLEAVIASIDDLMSESQKNAEDAQSNEKNRQEIVALTAKIEAKKESLDETTKMLDEATAKLTERDGLVVKMTADLLKAQQKEKELTSLIVKQNEASFSEKAETAIPEKEVKVKADKKAEGTTGVAVKAGKQVDAAVEKSVE